MAICRPILLTHIMIVALVTACSVEPKGARSGQGGGSDNSTLLGKKFTDPEFLCEDETQSSDEEATLALVDGPTYTNAISKLLSTNCISCHNPNGNKPDLSTYDLAVISAEVSLAEIEAGSMPLEGPLSDEDAAAFRTWVQEDTPEGCLLYTSPSPRDS